MNDKTVRQKKHGKQVSTQLYLPFAEIRDNVVVLKNGGMRAILETSSVNFYLKSEPEQNAIIYAYQNFLNTLEFPVQILVKSKKLDIDKYLDNLSDIGEQQSNPLLKKQAFEYVSYVKKLVEYADIMEKKFYVIVPFDPLRAKKSNIFSKFLDWLSPQDSIAKIRQRHREFYSFKKVLSQRVNLVKAGIEQCGLRVDQLVTKEIIELLYNTYNPVTSRNEKIKDTEGINLAAS